MPFLKLHWIRSFAAVLLLLSLSLAAAAESPGTRSQDSFKKKTERTKTVLLRSSDDLGRTLTYTNETIDLLKEQIEASASHEPDNKAKERLGLLEWYQRYADWLRGMSAEMDLEVSNLFSQQKVRAGWSTRYEGLAKGFRNLAEELGGMMRKLEGEKKKLEAHMQKLNTAVVERRILVGRDDLELARELWPMYQDRPYDRAEAVYKDLSEEEVLFFLNELRSCREQQKYFECLSELGEYEEAWLYLKADESARLYEIAGTISGNEPGQAASVFRSTIRTYEMDMAALKRRSEEIDRKIHGITKSGSLRMLDRLEELTLYYENMKSRYERHAEWLAVQIGGYQADLVELDKER